VLVSAAAETNWGRNYNVHFWCFLVFEIPLLAYHPRTFYTPRVWTTIHVRESVCAPADRSHTPTKAQARKVYIIYRSPVAKPS